jgi:GAF domain-containing protein
MVREEIEIGEGDSTIPEGEPEGAPQLAFLDARGEPRVLLLAARKRILIGRAASCDVSLRDPHVSRTHARVDAVEGLYVLTDAGSANGTSLNGHRISKETSLLLRDGDVIGVGETRIRFGHGPDVSDSAAHGGADTLELQLADASPDRSYRVEDLLGTGPAPDPGAQADFLRAFSGVTRAEGLGRSLALIAKLLEAHAAAIFVPAATQEGIEAAAAYPDADGASRLAEVAHPIMASERARIVRPQHHEIARLESTVAMVGVASAAAVPLHQGKRPIGVLAVERRHGACLDRTDLGRLAVLGEQLATTLGLQQASENDTRLGVDSD